MRGTEHSEDLNFIEITDKGIKIMKMKVGIIREYELIGISGFSAEYFE